MSQRGASSHRWRQRQDKDPYVQRAARDGWRGRAVYKLDEIQQKEKIFKRGLVCADLGSSPGSWSQYAVRKIGPEGVVLAVDLLPMDLIEGVEFVLGDFTSPGTVADIRQRLGDRKLGLVMSDMAPNISGNRAVDQPRSIALAEDALYFSDEVLGKGGDFLVKLFQGSGIDEFSGLARERFGKVKLVKPKASRAASREIYLLARDYLL